MWTPLQLTRDSGDAGYLWYTRFEHTCLLQRFGNLTTDIVRHRQKWPTSDANAAAPQLDRCFDARGHVGLVADCPDRQDALV